MSRTLMMLPPLLFAGLAAMFYTSMYRDNPDVLPSVLADARAQAPAVPPQSLEGIAPLRDEDLRSGEITLVNFWATWCPPCRAEHPVLLKLAADGVRVAGINIRDDAEKAEAYLADEGNPFFAVGFDPDGRNRIEWGVTAPPETFIVAGDGTVLFRFVGPLVGTDFEKRFLPELEKARAAQR
jgi:cytochrome c biogenesis protein CcmG, thiol:disulfide interchange protein DsbE